MIEKISLGTVQFGQDYGIANTTGKVAKGEVFKILDYAKYAGICNLDTALAYGDSEPVIGEYLKEHPGAFKVVSKAPSVERFKPGEVEKNLKASLSRMGLKKIYGYLLHRFSDVLLSDGIWNGFVRMKNDGLVEKIGFSLYAPDELALLMDRKFEFDIVQIPYSIFDRRFEKYFAVLASRNTEIQARSVFLQGLAFLDAQDLPVSLQAARPQLERLQLIADNRKIPIEAICLNFALLNPHIDRVLIGIDSLEQLKRNMAAMELLDNVKGILEQLRDIMIEKDDILMPTRWKLNRRGI